MARRGDGLQPLAGSVERSVAEPEEWGKVHIAVVNTVKANVLGPNAVGVHWIVIAWQVEGQVEGMDA